MYSLNFNNNPIKVNYMLNSLITNIKQNNLIKVHSKDPKDNGFGVREFITFENIQDYLDSYYKLNTKDIDGNSYQSIFEKK
tara:strand:- start:1632 stop:1874 length:243 start_codon:yes stop_codon:yes gene_type:complete